MGFFLDNHYNVWYYISVGELNERFDEDEKQEDLD